MLVVIFYQIPTMLGSARKMSEELELALMEYVKNTSNPETIPFYVVY